MTFPSFTTSGSAANGISGINVAFPATVNANDMALMYVQTANEPIATPSGWGVVGADGVNTAGGTDATALQIFWYRCDGSEDAATVALPDAGDHILAQILLYQDVVTSGDPINAVATDTLATAASTVTFPGLATTASDCKVFQCASRSRDSSTTIDFTGYANTDLASTQKQREAGTSSGNGGGFASCDGNLATAGVVGAGTCNLAGASCQAMVSFALMSTTSVVSGGRTGTLAATEGADTASLAGDVLVDGALAATEGADTASIAGDVLVEGALAATEGADTASIAGTLGSTITGALAATEGSDTASLAGGVIVSGTAAATESADTAAFGGLILIQGGLAATEGTDTAAFTNAAVVAAPVTITGSGSSSRSAGRGGFSRSAGRSAASRSAGGQRRSRNA